MHSISAVKDILNKRLFHCVFATLIAIFWICLFNTVLLKSTTALYICGHLTFWVAASLIVIAFFLRFTESTTRQLCLKIIIKRWHGYSEYTELNPAILIFLCAVSATLFQLPLLGAQAGVQWNWPHEFAMHSAVAGVLPFADAKQHYGAAIGMPVLDSMGGHLAARRPLHAANLATMFVFTGFDRFAVLAIQAALCGVTLMLACIYLSRIVGLAIAVAVWALVYRFTEGAIPSFMSATTGTWFGLIGFILVFASIIHRRFLLISIALGIFMLAFSARAGAYLILPALFICGLWYVHNNRRATIYFLSITLVIGVTCSSIPFAINKLYDSKGGEYQGNLVYILYMLSVGSDNWRQIIIDYPHSRKEIKPTSKWIGFAYSKTKDAFLADPALFFKTAAKSLLNSAQGMPESYMLNFIQPSDYEKYNEIGKYIKPFYLLLFYSGLLYLLLSRALPISLRLGLLLILVGYAISLPFIWLSPSIRFQAVTYIIPAILIAGPLSIRGTFMPPMSSKIPYLISITTFMWIIFCVFVPKVYHPDFPFNVANLKSRNLPNKQRIGYILTGPYMSYIRLKNDNAIHTRPDISINKFNNLRAIKENSINKNRLEPYKAGEQLIITWDVTKKVHRMYWSKPFCIPNKLWIYQVIISPQSPPYVYRLSDIKPLGKNGEPIKPGTRLPYKCL